MSADTQAFRSHREAAYRQGFLEGARRGIEAALAAKPFDSCGEQSDYGAGLDYGLDRYETVIRALDPATIAKGAGDGR